MWQRITKKLILILLCGILLLSNINAAPGVLAQSPLSNSGNVSNNLMFMLDNSSLMRAIVVESPYDPNVNYGDCPAGNQIDNTVPVDFQIFYGKPYFPRTICFGNIICFTLYDVAWGLGNNQQCFDNTKTYSAQLNKDENSAIANTYTGNYLNYYFNSSADAAWITHKPSARTRQEVQKTVVEQIVNNLVSIRVGLSKFNTLLVAVDDIDKNRSSLITAIDSVEANGDSPLAVTLHKIARYFRGDTNDTLKLHPGTTYEEQKSASTVFDNTLDYIPGVNKKSPIQYFCQKNFVVTISGGYSSGDTGINASTGLTDYDRDCIDPNAQCGPYDRKPGIDYKSNTASDYFDDIAMAIYDMDLLPALKNSQGEDVKNNIITYTVGFGVDNQLLKDAAAQGGGVYYTVNDADQLTQSLQNITSDISAQPSTATGIAINSQSLGADSAFFKTTYTGGTWTGNLFKIQLTQDGNVGQETWDAATSVDGMLPSKRFIFTYNRDTKKPVLFSQADQLSILQKADLSLAPNLSIDNLVQPRIDYLLGDQSKEGLLFRTRDSLLGDIVNSMPVFVGIAESTWPDIAPFPTGSDAYSKFASKVANRTKAVYVGNNNPGTLQGYNANTGELMMEYLPEILFSSQAQQGLHYLTDPAYNHRYYTDGSPVVQDAFIGNNWRTILMGGLNAGGKGYFALDVTDPSQFSSANIQNIFKWEFSAKDDLNMGYSFGKPIIGLLNNGRFAAIIPNGYNNSGTGTAVVYILYLDGAQNGSWQLGKDYLMFDTKQGALNNLNGASSVAAVDLDGNGTIDRVYMADIQGNLWALDLSSQSSSIWGFAYGSSSKPEPLFVSGLPITGGIQVVRNSEVATTTDNSPNLLVMFGTGQLLTTDDIPNTDKQFFYTVWDAGTSNLKKSDLMVQNFQFVNTTTRILNNKGVTYVKTNGEAKYGCYFDLPDKGERLITTPIIVGDNVYFTTTIPQTAQICEGSGSGWVMGVKVTNCGEPEFNIFDINNDSQINGNDQIKGHVVSGLFLDTSMPLQPIYRSGYIFVPNSDGTLQKFQVTTNPDKEGRISWHELRSSDPDLSSK